MDRGFQNFASDHGGWFPNADNPWDALAKLSSYFEVELAGLTGKIQLVTNALQTGQSISNLTSWVYVPGLRIDDDGRLAILWESKVGISASGRLIVHRTRPVLLLNHDITNVPAADWESFLKQQEQLRRAVRTKRAAQTNSPRFAP